MKIPQGADVQLKTDGGVIELHITAALTTKTQADELAKCIKKLAVALEGEKRQREPTRP